MQYTKEHLEQAEKQIEAIRVMVEEGHETYHDGHYSIIDSDTYYTFMSALADCEAAIEAAARRVTIMPDLLEQTRAQAQRAQQQRDVALAFIRKMILTEGDATVGREIKIKELIDQVEPGEIRRIDGVLIDRSDGV